MQPTLNPVACAVCGQLVETPHWCVESYEKAHAAVVRGNEYYRSVIYEQQLQSAEQEAPTHREHRQGIVDLTEWGNLVWCREKGFDVATVDQVAAQRATRVVALLTTEQQSELRKIYVLRCEVVRNALRSKRPAPGERLPGRPIKLPAFSGAERAYLCASKDGLRQRE